MNSTEAHVYDNYDNITITDSVHDTNNYNEVKMALDTITTDTTVQKPGTTFLRRMRSGEAVENILEIMMDSQCPLNLFG